MGVRGVRLNFKSVGANPSASELEASLRAYADAVRPFDWPLELYIALENVPMIENVVDSLGVKVIIDHFGHPTAQSLSTAQNAHEIQGFSSLVNLLKQGNTWVKISASYRLTKDPGSKIVESLCREIVKVRSDRVVFATDWPHTRFDDVVVADYLEKILDWCEEEGVDLSQVLVKNAEVLFDA
jgi:predicted TIM-barrel fold metal-dependent hydrolase